MDLDTIVKALQQAGFDSVERIDSPNELVVGFEDPEGNLWFATFTPA
jgi:hypothetical protein